jgi:hypothetical protein
MDSIRRQELFPWAAFVFLRSNVSDQTLLWRRMPEIYCGKRNMILRLVSKTPDMVTESGIFASESPPITVFYQRLDQLICR